MKQKLRKDNSLAIECEKWKDKLEAGCYPYALKIPINEFCLIGEFIGNPCTGITSEKELIETFKQEVQEIFNYKLEETNWETIPKDNQFKVILVRDFHSGYYHFYRQNSEGVFTDKIPGELPMLATEREILGENKQIWFFLVENSREPM